MTALMLLALAGCWKPYDELPELDFDEVPYDNPHLEATDAVISAFDTTLACPDGGDARFFAVYKKSVEGPAPVAIVLHSGVFDYVVAPDPAGYLKGEHYQGESRLSRSWAIGKVWETLGINPNVIDPSEENLGTLPAALTDAGFLQLYPANCWGDLWHNEEGVTYNDDQEPFRRNGRTFAWWMIKMLIESNFAMDHDFRVPMTVDTAQIYLVGLGEGGRGVAELVAHDNLPPVAGILVDSPADDLGPYLADPNGFADEIVGLERIFLEENLETISDWSLLALSEADLLPDRVGYVWSAADPEHPLETAEATAEALSAIPNAWVHDTHEAGHVFLNADPELAADAVTFLQYGTIPQ